MSSERSSLFARVSRGILTASVAVSAFLLAATGSGHPFRLALGPLRLTSSGAERPFFVLLGSLVLLGVLRDGWLRRLAASLRGQAEVPAPLPRAARAARAVLFAASAAFLALPAVLPPTRPWPSEPAVGIAYVLIAATAILYAFLSARGLFGPVARDGRRLTGLDFGLLVLLPLYVLSTSNGLLHTSGDNMATRLLAPHLVRTGSLDLTGVGEFASEPDHYSGVRHGGKLLPAFPLGTGLLAVPYAALALPFSGAPLEPDLVDRWEKHFSALCLVAATALLFLGLRRRFGEGPALVTSLVFALGTTAFSCAGQAVFSTTGEVLCLAAALFFLVPEDRERPAAAAGGLALAAAFLCRPSAALPAAFLSAWLLFSGRKRDAFLCGGAFGLGAAASCAWLFSLYGHPLGGYGLMNVRSGAWGTTFLAGLAGNLVSPSRGLLVFFPYLLLLPFVLGPIRQTKGLASLWAASLAATLAPVLLSAAYYKWWGGHSIGPRLLTEASPFIALLTLPLWIEFRRLPLAVRGTAIVLVLFAAVTQVLGVWSPRAGAWNSAVNVDWNPAARFSLRDSQILATWWPGWYPSWKRTPRMRVEDDPARWVRVDISPAANTRYDRDPFRPSPPRDSLVHYPALDADALDDRKALFHFLPKGKPNAATTCQGGGAFEVPLPGLAAAKLHLLLTAGATRRREGFPAIASVTLVYADGLEEQHDVRLDRDVWEYDPSRRSAPVDAARIYLGRPDEPDVLVSLALSPARAGVPLRLLRVGNVDPGSGEGVTLFAATLERPSP